MAKRPNHAGSPYQDKAGRWYAAISLPGVGRIRERATDKLDAEARLVALRARRDAGTAQQPTKLTVAAWADQGLVWPNRTGGITRNAAAVTLSLKTAMAKIPGFPHITPHDLRHTYATRLLEAGVHLLWVSRQLGHGTISITADIYGQTVPQMMSDTAAAAGRIFD